MLRLVGKITGAMQVQWFRNKQEVFTRYEPCLWIPHGPGVDKTQWEWKAIDYLEDGEENQLGYSSLPKAWQVAQDFCDEHEIDPCLIFIRKVETTVYDFDQIMKYMAAERKKDENATLAMLMERF